jgi:putative two-component system response regulator
MNAVLNETHRPTVLAVDDSPQNLSLMVGLLCDHYEVRVARDGEQALMIAQSSTPPDLILLDVVMPEMDGYAVCRQLKANPRTAGIPVIFLTAKNEIEDEQQGFALGAADYITKPISAPIMLARVKTHLTLKVSVDFLRDKNNFLEQEVARRTEEVRAIKDATIVMMASLAETRDNETGNHILRTQHYVRALAGALQTHPRFTRILSKRNIDLLFKSAPLHDIGKVGIPDSILLKPGPLTQEEFEVMKTHTTLGRDAIEMAEHRLGRPVPFLLFAKEIAYSHQEKWDGSGYPQGLAGDNIPISARLMSVADVYDALISRRVYKPPMSHEQAVDFIMAGRGHHFDPDVANAFWTIRDQCQSIALLFADPETDAPHDTGFTAVSSERRSPPAMRRDLGWLG